jgi:hypothetical protein
MNRVLNKDLALGFSLNSALISFSDVLTLHPVCRVVMQENQKGYIKPLLQSFFYLLHASSASRAGESMRSSNAC